MASSKVLSSGKGTNVGAGPAKVPFGSGTAGNQVAGQSASMGSSSGKFPKGGTGPMFPKGSASPAKPA